jgi:hypothetical protein
LLEGPNPLLAALDIKTPQRIYLNNQPNEGLCKTLFTQFGVDIDMILANEMTNN